MITTVLGLPTRPARSERNLLRLSFDSD